MKRFEFPTHPDKKWVELRRKVRSGWERLLSRVQASVVATLTFEWEPSDPESVLKLVKEYAERWLSGGVYERVDWLAVAERGPGGDRLHSHGLFWSESLRDNFELCGDLWTYGKAEASPFRPGGGAEGYIAKKIAFGEVWNCSTSLVDRLGPFPGSGAILIDSPA